MSGHAIIKNYYPGLSENLTRLASTSHNFLTVGPCTNLEAANINNSKTLTSTITSRALHGFEKPFKYYFVLTEIITPLALTGILGMVPNGLP